MKQHFYSHIIEISTIHTALNDLDLDDEEKNELIVVVESSIHHVVMDTVLSELSDEDKKALLMHIHEEKHESVWDLLKAKVHNVEEKIKTAVQAITNEFHSDIAEAKKLPKDNS